MSGVNYEVKSGKPSRLIHATRYSMQGLKWMWRNEPSFRYELFWLALLTPLNWYLDFSLMQKLAIQMLMFLVIFAEVLNTAIEAVVDRVSTEHHPLTGVAKDCGSAAVFITMMMVVITWLVVLFDNGYIRL